MNRSHYSVLKVDTTASHDDIKKAYKKRLLDTHPDKTGLDTTDDSCTVNQIQDAFKILSNEESRRQYNQQLEDIQKKQGFHNYGDGVDDYSLDEFEFNDSSSCYSMNCPRCKTLEGIQITENDLERHVDDSSQDNNEYQILVQCISCSLWLKILFDVEE